MVTEFSSASPMKILCGLYVYTTLTRTYRVRSGEQCYHGKWVGGWGWGVVGRDEGDIHVHWRDGGTSNIGDILECTWSPCPWANTARRPQEVAHWHDRQALDPSREVSGSWREDGDVKGADGGWEGRSPLSGCLCVIWASGTQGTGVHTDQCSSKTHCQLSPRPGGHGDAGFAGHTVYRTCL